MPNERTLSGAAMILIDSSTAGIAVALAISVAALVLLGRLLQTVHTLPGPARPVRRAGGQIRGTRAVQEDELGFIDGATLDPQGEHPVAVVADGMGGHVGGDVASRLAVRAFIAAYATSGRPPDRLRHALERTNAAIGAAIRENPARQGMGTTLVAAALTAEGLDWISVGDSPLLLYREGRLKRLNDDHSMAPVITAMRDVDPEAAAGMNPHELRSVLAGAEIARIDASKMPELLQSGDLVLLATDGLATLGEDEAAGVIEQARAAGPVAVRDALLAAVEARRNPTQDNLSVALLETPPLPTAESEPA